MTTMEIHSVLKVIPVVCPISKRQFYRYEIELPGYGFLQTDCRERIIQAVEELLSGRVNEQWEAGKR